MVSNTRAIPTSFLFPFLYHSLEQKNKYVYEHWHLNGDFADVHKSLQIGYPIRIDVYQFYVTREFSRFTHIQPLGSFCVQSLLQKIFF